MIFVEGICCWEEMKGEEAVLDGLAVWGIFCFCDVID